MELKYLLANGNGIPEPVYQQLMAWRKKGKRSKVMPSEIIKTWLDFEVEVRQNARQDLSKECPYIRPEDVHTFEDESGKRNKLQVEPFESFYMTKEEFEGDMEYLREIYDYYKPTEKQLFHYWKWGKFLWIKGITIGLIDKPYKEGCAASRDCEMRVRTILKEYTEDCLKYGNLEFLKE